MSSSDIIKTRIANRLSPYANAMEDERLGMFLVFSIGRVLGKHKINPEDISDEKIQHISDWLQASIINNANWILNVDELGRPKKLMKFSSVEQIIQEANKDMLKHAQKHVSNIPLLPKDERLYAQLKDGYHIVRLETPEALDRESGRMQHCIGQGGYDDKLKNKNYSYLSLRDPAGKPHVTLEIKNKQILQVQGKQNESPLRIYRDKLIPFFQEKKYNLDKVSSYIDLVKDIKGNIYDINELPEDTKISIAGTLKMKNIAHPRMPNNLEVTKSLIIDRTSNMHILKLPRTLKVGKNLKIKNTNIHKLPDILTVDGGISIESCKLKDFPKFLTFNYLSLQSTHIETKLPDGLIIKDDLCLHGASFDELPKNLYVGRNFFLGETKNKRLPNDLKIGDSLIAFSSALEEIPATIEVGNNIILSHTINLKEFPGNFNVNGDLDLCYSSIQTLGKNLYVAKRLSLSFSNDIKVLPEGLNVGTLNIRETNINNIPQGTIVRDRIILKPNQITHLPESIGEDVIIELEEYQLNGLLNKTAKEYRELLNAEPRYIPSFMRN